MAWAEIFHATDVAGKAKNLAGIQTAQAFAQASRHYARAVEIKPDKYEAFNNWGIALISMAHLLNGPEREAVLDDAEAKGLRAQEITGKADYNLACIHAMRGRRRRRWRRCRLASATAPCRMGRIWMRTAILT
jgi:hypothetical protein